MERAIAKIAICTDMSKEAEARLPDPVSRLPLENLAFICCDVYVGSIQ